MGAVYFSDGVVRFRDADESDDGGFGLPEEAAGVAVGETGHQDAQGSGHRRVGGPAADAER